MLDCAPIILQLTGAMQIRLYTDGACDIHAANQPGGWAAILQAVNDAGEQVKETVLSGGAEKTTNNQMELTAVIAGLQALKRQSRVTIFTDSRYVIDIARGAKKAGMNKRLWETYFKLAEQHFVKLSYVAGHSGDELNERCDRLAVAERKKYARRLTSSDAANEAHVETALKIYLSTQTSKKQGASAWAAVIVSGDGVRLMSGLQTDASELEATLIGAIRSVESLPSGLSATILTAQEYLSKGMNNWLKGWAARGWKTRGGEPVKYQAHWRNLQKLERERELHFRFVKAREEIDHFQQGKELAAEALKQA